MAYAVRASVLVTLFLLVVVCVCADEQQPDEFAAQAADMIDNTLLSFRNGIKNMFEDGSRLGSFFSNVTTHFKKLTGMEEKP